jgi:hypothetical protein
VRPQLSPLHPLVRDAGCEPILLSHQRFDMPKRKPPAAPIDPQPPTNGDVILILPRYDTDLRELWVGHLLIKRFTGPAKNQQLILSCFQETAWERLLWDPLPGQANMHAGLRLNKVAEKLNGRQRPHMLRFRICHDSTAIIWQWSVTAEVLRQLLAAPNRVTAAAQ